MQLGRYELLGKLGEGGFATVYRAWDPTLERHVALKLLDRLSDDPDVQRRFLGEARAIASLRHPNIVQFFDVGEADGRPFYTMEVIEGPTLRDLLIQDQRLPLERVVAMLKSLASAIDYLHGAGLVHRDIKASNVMLDPSWRVVLMDFGIVRSIDRTQHTRTGASLGTPEAMAPEQVRGVQVGAAADVYALGVLAYQLLAGRAPFVGDTAYVLHAQVYEAPPPLAALRPGLPEHVYRAVEWALAKEPEARPQSAATFVQAVEGATPVLARTAVPRETGRISAPDAPQRKRGRGTTLVLASVTAVALTGLAVGGAVLVASAGGRNGNQRTVAIAPTSARPADTPIKVTTATQVPTAVSVAASAQASAIAGNAPATSGTPAAIAAPPTRPPATSPSPTRAPTPVPLLAPGEVRTLNISDQADWPDCLRSDFKPQLKHELDITEIQRTGPASLRIHYSTTVPASAGVPCSVQYVPEDGDNVSPLLIDTKLQGVSVTLLSRDTTGGQIPPPVEIYGRRYEADWYFDNVDFTNTANLVLKQELRQTKRDGTLAIVELHSLTILSK